MPHLMISLLHTTILFSGVDARRARPSVHAHGKNGTSDFSALQQETTDFGIWEVWDLPVARCKLHDRFMGSCATGDTSLEEDWECMGCPGHLHTSLALEYQHRFWDYYWGKWPLESCPWYDPLYTGTRSVDPCDGSDDVHLRIRRKWFDFTEHKRDVYRTAYHFEAGYCKGNGYPPILEMSAPGNTGDNLDQYCRKSCDMDFGRCLAYETNNRRETCTLVYMSRVDAKIEGVWYPSIVWDPVDRGDGGSIGRCSFRPQEEMYSPPHWMLLTGFFDDIYAYLVEDYREPFDGDCYTLLLRKPDPFKRPSISRASECRDKCDKFWERCVAYSTNGGKCLLFEYMMIAEQGTEIWNPITRGIGGGGWRCWVKTLPFSPPGMAFDWGVSDMITW